MIARSSGRNPASSAGHWAQSGSNPILSPAAGEVNASWAVVFPDAGTYHMLYSYEVSGHDVIGHATASSPVGPWTKDAAHNPVMSVGAGGQWDEYAVYVCDFWKEGSTWYLVYLGFTDEHDCKHGLATSSNLLTWTKSGSNPVHAASYDWEKSDDGTLSYLDCGPILKVGSTYYFYYSTYIRSDRCIGVATSTNLTTWTKLYTTDPLFKSERYCPGIFKYGDHYYMTVSHYTAEFQYSDIELWRSLSPTFSNPELVRVVAPNNPASSWQELDLEMFNVITSDIERVTFPDNRLYVLMSGSDIDGIWRQGIIQENDIAAALTFT
jgi:predicted GH43/DUF377 family glycosyl hydrolase